MILKSVTYEYEMIHIHELHKMLGTERLKLFQTNEVQKNETEYLMPPYISLVKPVLKIVNQETKCI